MPPANGTAAPGSRAALLTRHSSLQHTAMDGSTAEGTLRHTTLSLCCSLFRSSSGTHSVSLRTAAKHHSRPHGAQHTPRATAFFNTEIPQPSLSVCFLNQSSRKMTIKACVRSEHTSRHSSTLPHTLVRQGTAAHKNPTLVAAVTCESKHP